MSKLALGLIETVGLAAAVEAADAAVKSANVNLIGYELTKGDGMVTVKVEGDVGSVKAAVNSATVAASKVGAVYSSHVIPRPAPGLEDIVLSKDTVGLAVAEKSVAEKSVADEHAPEESSPEEILTEHNLTENNLTENNLSESNLSESNLSESILADEPVAEALEAEEAPVEEAAAETEKPEAEELETEEPEAEEPTPKAGSTSKKKRKTKQ